MYEDGGRVPIETMDLDIMKTDHIPLPPLYGDHDVDSVTELALPDGVTVPKKYEAYQEPGLGFTTGDKIQLAGSSIAPLYNAAMSMTGSQKEKPRYNTEGGRAMSIAGNNRINMDSVSRDINLAGNVNKRSINESSGSSASRLANLLGNTANTQRALTNARMQEGMSNAQLKSQEASLRAGIGAQNAQANAYADELNARNEGIRQSFGSSAMSQIGNSLTTFGQGKNTVGMNNLTLATINNLSAKYGIEAGTLRSLINSGQVQSEADLVKYKGG